MRTYDVEREQHCVVDCIDRDRVYMEPWVKMYSIIRSWKICCEEMLHMAETWDLGLGICEARQCIDLTPFILSFRPQAWLPTPMPATRRLASVRIESSVLSLRRALKGAAHPPRVPHHAEHLYNAQFCGGDIERIDVGR